MTLLPKRRVAWWLLLVVAVLHGLLFYLLQIAQTRQKVATTRVAQEQIISLALLPLPLQPAVMADSAPGKRKDAADKPVTPVARKPVDRVFLSEPLSNSSAAMQTNTVTAQGGAVTTDSEAQVQAPALNLTLPKNFKPDAAPRPWAQLPTSTPKTPWSEFAKLLTSAPDYREERMPDNRLRVYVKGHCFELAESAAQRLDPFHKAQEFVLPCSN